jgi:hypothetical protein
MKRLGLGIIVAIGLTLPAFGQGVDPLVGTWKLNNAKSAGSAWRSLTITFTAAEGRNLVGVTDGVDTQGNQLHGTLRHTYDGTPHPTDSNPDADSTSYTRPDDTISIVRFKQGKVVGSHPVGIASLSSAPSRAFLLYRRKPNHSGVNLSELGPLYRAIPNSPVFTPPAGQTPTAFLSTTRAVDTRG